MAAMVITKVAGICSEAIALNRAVELQAMVIVSAAVLLFGDAVLRR
jgi:hypothetical protein